MGGLLRFPLGSILKAIAEKGILYCIWYSVCYVYLSIVKKIGGRRFDLYDLRVDNQPEKAGFFVPHLEWQLDTPQEDTSLRQNSDDVFCYGVNSKSEALAMHVSRLPNGDVRCSLYLKLADGRRFVLPEDHVLQKEVNEDYTFGSSRMKLQCLLPMRKWRIFFNGLLKEENDSKDDSEKRYRHVTFTFIFTASSGVFDFSTDMSKELLSENATNSATWKSLPLFILQRMQSIFNSYEQSGMIFGTLQVEDEDEQEIYLWGNRGHFMGKTRNLKDSSFLQIYGTLENGAVLHLGILGLQGIAKRFTYGYVMRSDGFIHPIESLIGEGSTSSNGQRKFRFFCGGVNYVIQVKETREKASCFEKEFSGSCRAKYIEMVVNDMQGRGFVFYGSIKEKPRSKICYVVRPHESAKEMSLSIPFHEAVCQNSALTGGKGSSLGKLFALSTEKYEVGGAQKKSQSTQTFEVPKGFVITTNAYKLFVRGGLNDALQKFQSTVWSKKDGDLKDLCNRVVTEVRKAKLPNRISDVVKNELEEIYPRGLAGKKFAVRSSATGEDTEQMSAAGQMETFLGLKSIDEILEAIKKCWASQFTFQAVAYKRRYGQLLNTPMAVVVQEMVPCEVAGVAFTCDPITGNPSYITLTANWGLGESVVSASAEPDMITLKRDIKNELKWESRQIGDKKKKIIMDDESGTKEMDIGGEEASTCCLTEGMALKLGNVMIKIEEHFGSPRDLEWGVIGQKVFLFQARPITTLDKDTDFEMKHEFDTQIRMENEYISVANVGEVMPGAISPLGFDLLAKCMEMCYPRQKYADYDMVILPKEPYYPKRLIYLNRHIFFPVLDSFMKFEEDDEITKSMLISLYGRDIRNEELQKIANERHQVHGKNDGPSLLNSMLINANMFVGGYFTRQLEKKIDKFEVSLPINTSACHIFTQISNCYDRLPTAMNSHMVCSYSSSIWNNSLLDLLSNAKGECNNDVYSDFGYLLSTCKNLESADVPASIQKLSYEIAKTIDPNKFKQMNPTEALTWLQNSDTMAGRKFKQFLKRHGHRCLKEFDVYIQPWADNPKSLVNMLQGIVSSSSKEATEKPVPYFTTILSKMQIPLNLISKLKLYFLLPNCRRGVREREYSKSLVIKSVYKVRKAYQRLADAMVTEGYLPHRDLLFFLYVEEINQLLKTRSPRLVTRAIKRQKCHEEMDLQKFPEIVRGIPKPISGYKDLDSSVSGFSMTGIPVSQGVVKATARVIINIDEANNLQEGDILITYSTDIGWSPYFTMLAGVVTELGGLFSHGAVVAREYGLPCVVGLHGATHAFKSGDTVILDGTKGILKRVDD